MTVTVTTENVSVVLFFILKKFSFAGISVSVSGQASFVFGNNGVFRFLKKWVVYIVHCTTKQSRTCDLLHLWRTGGDAMKPQVNIKREN